MDLRKKPTINYKSIRTNYRKNQAEQPAVTEPKNVSDNPTTSVQAYDSNEDDDDAISKIK